MCGITGFNWEDKELVTKMSDVISHRGPDSSGMYTNTGISLGHRRLSIIDLSKKGTQPMCNEEGDIWITFNGEIYNFKHLRSVLEKKGHVFESNTDTEVIVHGYEEWGKQVVEKLNGQFAFAIWDDTQKELFLARDRLGIKPLYYWWDNEKFIFGSEIKSILTAGVKRQVNKIAAFEYLNNRYIPGEDTLLQGIKKVLPGHTLCLKGSSLVMEKFWDLPLPANAEPTKVAERVEEELTASIWERMVADVPLGVYLSGGLDSASIVGIMSKFKKDVKTFSVGFNSQNDELSKAKKIAEHFNTDHHEIVVDGEIGPLLPKILWHLDMPHGDPVVIPMLKLSELASKKVKVVLSGEGADETFGGYVQYKTMLQAQKVSKVPSFLMSGIAKQVPVSVYDTFFDYPSSIGEKGKEKVSDFITDLGDEEKAYKNLVSITSKKDQEKMNLSGVGNSYFQKLRKPLLHRMLYYDTKTWLPNYVLYINDRMTMANSIEGRVPFLDHHFVEYVNTLGTKFKLAGGVNKVALRKAMAKTLPKPDTKKHAFFMPLDKWYKEELKGMAEELFTPSSVSSRGYFDYRHIKNIWERYNRSKLLYGKQLFTLINFELWHRMFIDGDAKNVSMEQLL